MRSADESAVATLTDWYLGEVGGEQLFAILSEHAPDDDQRRAWAHLAALEHTVAARIARELERLGVRAPDVETAARQAALGAEPYRGLRFADAARRFEPRVVAALARLTREADELPPRHAPLAVRVLDHERVLVEIFRAPHIDSPAIRARLLAFLRAHA